MNQPAAIFTPATNTKLDERKALDLLIRGFQISRMLRLVADLGLADKVPAAEKAPVSDLAQACSVHAAPLLRILRALAAFGVFTVSADGSIGHTERSLLLRTDAPNSLHYSARFWTGPGSWRAWDKLDVALHGESPHEAAWQTSRFAYLKEHPEEARVFDDMMANFPDDRHPAIAAAYDFSGAKLIADIGGGNGAALRAILARAPNGRGLVFDRPDVVANLSSAQVLDGRIAAEGGDFLAHVPEGADIYLLIRVLHDWDDANCCRILKQCRAAMDPSAKLILGEELLEPNPEHGHPTAYLIDTHMMTMFGQARARSEDEFKGLLSRSGFGLSRIISTSSSVSLVEAKPI
jgi:hypothetical protein